jgi:colicin import membrane protein
VKIDWSEPGVIVSAGTHAVLLLAALMAFSDTGKFDDAMEALPVEVISADEMARITTGERDAKIPVPVPKPRADQVSELQDTRPQTPLELKRDVPAPPARPPEVEKPDPTASIQPPAPPERPKAVDEQAAKAKAAQAKAEADAKESAQLEAEALERAKAQKAREAKAKAEADAKSKKEAEAKAEARKLTALAADAAKPKPPAKPVAEKGFDPNEIKDKILQSREKPQAAPSTAQQVVRTAMQGAETGAAANNSGQFDGLKQSIREQLDQCWTFPASIGDGENYRPQVRFRMDSAGTLVGEPVLLNASAEPRHTILAESALRAVRKCSPFNILPQFRSLVTGGKDWVIDFDPKSHQG